MKIVKPGTLSVGAQKVRSPTECSGLSAMLLSKFSKKKLVYDTYCRCSSSAVFFGNWVVREVSIKDPESVSDIRTPVCYIIASE